MFARRHPYLFFILMFITVSASFFILLSTIIGLTVGSVSDFDTHDRKKGEKVGIVEVNGIIGESDQIVESIKKFRENDSVKAIVLRIDSPGGGVGASQEIYKEIEKTIGKKSVIASMGSVAASGGYYIAAPATGIIANPGTITGSIGVLLNFTNFENLLSKIGLESFVLKSGEYKDVGSPVRKMSNNERDFLENFLKNIHMQFIRDVSEGRSIEFAQVEKIADGRIYTGEEAKELGLIDRLGNIEDAIEWAGKEGNIEGKIEVVYAEKEKFSFLKHLPDSKSLIDAIATTKQIAYLWR